MDSGLGNSSVEDVATATVTTLDRVAADGMVAPHQQSPTTNSIGCQQGEGGDCAKCGEKRSLDAILVEELNLEFERRLRIIEQNGNDDHVKVAVYDDWTKQLTMFSLDLVGVIRELQDTCRNRLEVMKASYKKNLSNFGPEALQQLKSDRDSLLAVIRRAYATDYDSGQSQNDSNNDGPTISVNVEVASNCQNENSQIEKLRQELQAKERQIQNLENLREQQYPVPAAYHDGSVIETENDLRTDECDVTNKLLLQQLRQLVTEKNKELNKRSNLIDQLCGEIDTLKSRLEEMEASSQLDSDLSRSLTDLKLDDSEMSNTKLLQQLQILSRVKTEELDAKTRENDELRKEICSLKKEVDCQSKVDNQSLVSEIGDLYDQNRRLEKRLRYYEKLLREAKSAVNHKNKVIEQQRNEVQSLRKCLPAESRLHEFMASASNIDTMSVYSSESVTSFGSVNSGSSTETVAVRPFATTKTTMGAAAAGLDRLFGGSELETENVLCLKHELEAMGEQLRLFKATKESQDEIISEQCTRLDANESEMKILRNEYENNKKKLFLVRAEIVRLIKAVRAGLKGQFQLPQTIKSIEEFVSQPLIGVNMTDFSLDIFEKDKAILGALQQHLDVLTRSCLLTAVEQKEMSKKLDKEKSALQQEKKQYEELIEALQKQRLADDCAVKTDEKETSIDSEIGTSETLVAQRVQMQNVLRDLAVQITYLV